jgi:hypothetical protein
MGEMPSTLSLGGGEKYFFCGSQSSAIHPFYASGIEAKTLQS